MIVPQDLAEMLATARAFYLRLEQSESALGRIGFSVDLDLENNPYTIAHELLENMVSTYFANSENNSDELIDRCFDFIYGSTLECCIDAFIEGLERYEL